MSANLNANSNNNGQYVVNCAKEDFGSYLVNVVSNTGEGNYKILDREAFLHAGGYYNPIKALATVIRTCADILEVPTFMPVAGWDCDIKKDEDSKSVSIKLYNAYAKFMVSKNMFNKIVACDQYLKNILTSKIAALEKEAVFLGDGIKSPKGIIHQYFENLKKKGQNFFDKQIISGDYDLKKVITEMLCQLNPIYYDSSVFIVSSRTFEKLLEVDKDNSGKRYFEPLTTLYGHKFIIMNEVVELFREKNPDGTVKEGGKIDTYDHIILADFKQAVAIVEGEDDVIKIHSNYDRPNMVGISMPVSLGVGILNYDAIVCRKLKFEKTGV